MPKKPFNITAELNGCLNELESILEKQKNHQDDTFEDLKKSMKNLSEQNSAEDSLEDLKVLNCNQASLVRMVEHSNQLESFAVKLRRIVFENGKIQKQNSTDALPRAKKSKPDTDFLIIDESNSAINNENYFCHIDKTLNHLLERRKTPPPTFSPQRLKSPPRITENRWCPSSPMSDQPVCYWGI